MIPLNIKDSTENLKLSYTFSSKEIALLAKYFRNHQEDIPNGLENFSKALEESIYNSLSLDEVRKFFS